MKTITQNFSDDYVMYCLAGVFRKKKVQPASFYTSDYR